MVDASLISQCPSRKRAGCDVQEIVYSVPSSSRKVFVLGVDNPLHTCRFPLDLGLHKLEQQL